ncbi:hypothetical protein PMAYCL1PPCAC_11223, partial [Pristionchus mayeri]
RVMRSLVLLAASLGVASAYLGIDAEQAISTSTFSCLKDNGYSFYISRIYRSNGAIDTTGIQNIKNAWSAGLSFVDAYIFPCHSSSCPSAAGQVENALNEMWSRGAMVGTVWIDVEIYNWSSNQGANRQFILDMVNKASEMGVYVGIYTNNNNWDEIVGINWSGVSQYPLWWANYNGQANFNNFKPFGGWSKPAIHQYTGDIKGPCSMGNFDQNWYP